MTHALPYNLIKRLFIITLLAFTGFILIVSTASAQTSPVVDPKGVSPKAPNPLEGTSWYVDPENPAWTKWQKLKRQGKGYKANLIWDIAKEPKFRWFGKFTRPKPIKKIRDYINRAKEQNTIPLIATLRHQGKQCNPFYKAGGKKEDRRTKAWFRMFAKAIGDERVVIAYEPDSVGTIDCLAKSRRDDRIKVLRYGIDVLSKLPNATIYIEAGASDWGPAHRTAKLLKRIGVRKVRGFMLNVTHNDWTQYNIKYGNEISRRVGGKHFIISTHENGRGPVHYQKWIDKAKGKWRRINIWCHPLKRGLGFSPTTDTHGSKVDAYMWIGRPGYSGGSCNNGPIPIGTWFQKRAEELVRFRTNWLKGPKGTRNGWYGKPSIKSLAGDQFQGGPVKRPF